MPLLADKIVEGGLWSPKPRQWVGYTRSEERLLRMNGNIQDLLLNEVPVVACSNVARYLEEQEEAGREWQFEDFPNCAPPFDIAWFEYTPGPKTKRMSAGLMNVGVMLVSSDLTDPHHRSKYEHLPAFSAFFQPDGARWVMTCVIVLDYQPSNRAVIPGLLHVGVRADGTLIRNFTGSTFESVTKNLEPTLQEGQERFGADLAAMDDDHRLMSALCGEMYPIWLSLSMMHCRNVTVQSQEAPRSERRRAKREGKPRPPLRFNTINIAPMQRVLRNEGGSHETGLHNALHICRGHFKHFDEKPLFGKFKGTFWWDSMVRGTKSHGQVVSTYNVEAE
jgi:hypothetical protein